MKSGHLAKVPFIEQMHQTECGICCLAMILEYYHSKESLARIREELEIGRDGLKLSQLYAYAKKRNMDAKVFSADFEALQKMPLPAIAFWNQEHYIVIERIKKKEVVIVDPAIGRICMSHEDFVNGYSKVVMVLMPEENFDKRCEKGHLWGDVIKKVIWKNNLFLKTALITFLTYALQLTISLIVQEVVDASTNRYQYPVVVKYVYVAVGIVVIYGIMTYIRKKSLIRLQMEVDRHLTKETFSKMLKLPYQYYERRTNGDLLFRLNCLPLIRDLLSDHVMTGVIQAGFVVIIMICMILKSPLLALTVAVILALNAVFIMAIRKKIVAANQIQIVENTKLQSIQVETVQSIFNIKTAGIEEEFFSNWLSRYGKGMQAYEVKNQILNIYQTILNLFQIMGPFLVLWVGIYLNLQGVITVGVAIACYSLANTVFGACISVFHMWNDFTIATAYMERIKDITDT